MIYVQIYNYRFNFYVVYDTISYQCFINFAYDLWYQIVIWYTLFRQITIQKLFRYKLLYSQRQYYYDYKPQYLKCHATSLFLVDSNIHFLDVSECYFLSQYTPRQLRDFSGTNTKIICVTMYIFFVLYILLSI